MELLTNKEESIAGTFSDVRELSTESFFKCSAVVTTCTMARGVSRDNPPMCVSWAVSRYQGAGKALCDQLHQ